MFTDKQIQWSKEHLKEIMDGSQKTRYKALATNPIDLKQAEDSLLLIAYTKKQAYLDAFNGKPGSNFGQSNVNFQLSEATITIQHLLVDMSDIAMIPEI